MAWEITSLTLDGDKITEKVGEISLRFPLAYNSTEDFEYSTRFPIGEGTDAKQLALLVTNANTAKDEFIARRTAEDNLKTPILNALNP